MIKSYKGRILLGRMVDLNNSETTGRVYSLSGQSLCDADDMDSLPKGIYIVNGKKVIK